MTFTPPATDAGLPPVRRSRGAFPFRLLLGLLLGNLFFCVAVAWRSSRIARTLVFPVRKPVQKPEGMESGWRDVSWRTDDGLTIRGWYFPASNRAALILTHGFGENRAEKWELANVFVRKGYGVLLFDWRAHGESDGERVTWGDRERADLTGALDFLSALPDIDRGRIGIVGFSMGGVVAAEVAAQDLRLAAVVLEGTVPSVRETIRQDFSKWGWLSRFPAEETIRRSGVNLDATDTVASAARIAPRPVFVLHGEIGDVSREEAGRLFAATGEPHWLWQVPGAGHGDYHRVAAGEYVRRLSAFFDAVLPGT
ncbi:MAG: alpha/beta fold hydrolase [Capsulimonadales bacterium]|nr:alpha/beta fold hydrolase [Capsulimonadales bacterium]